MAVQFIKVSGWKMKIPATPFMEVCGWTIGSSYIIHGGERLEGCFQQS